MKINCAVIALSLCAAGCGNRVMGPAEEILHEDYHEGRLTMWSYDVRSKPIEEQRRVKKSLREDMERIFDAYLMIGCTNDTMMSRLNKEYWQVMERISKEVE